MKTTLSDGGSTLGRLLWVSSTTTHNKTYRRREVDVYPRVECGRRDWTRIPGLMVQHTNRSRALLSTSDRAPRRSNAEETRSYWNVTEHRLSGTLETVYCLAVASMGCPSKDAHDRIFTERNHESKAEELTVCTRLFSWTIASTEPRN